ncbi:MAG TPA: ABC transporter permease [Polyangiaceae bacterium]|nr:ABC transporter permease [Polyangiaceae bacterium]
MWRYLIKRVCLMIPTLLGVTLICFFILRAANADPISQAADASLSERQISKEALEHLRRLYSLDQPWYIQYWRLLRRFITLDLGNRWQDGRAIADVIGEALPITLILSTASLIGAYALAIPLGILAAARRGSRVDSVLSLCLFLLYSLPSYWAGTMLLVFLGSGRFIRCSWIEGGGCFPLQGWHSFQGFEQGTFWSQCMDVWWHITLPVVTLTYGSLASLSRYMRSGMLETLRQDYIRTAWAKGLPERRILYVHAFRNGVIPIITLLGLTLPYLISGSVIVEQIFGIRGMGYVALEAIRLPDYPLVVTVVAFTALATMIGVLISDLLYAVVDPRIRLFGAGA